MSDWRDRSPEFVDVREYDDGRPIVVMDLVPPDADVMREAWSELTRRWLDLPPHANVLDAVDRSGPLGLLVRFAAIDWTRKALVLDAQNYATLTAAAWGLQLCYAVSFLEGEVDAADRGWFLNPLVKVDIDEQVRLAFLPVAPSHRVVGRFVAPELRQEWPRCDEPGLVYLVGKALGELLEPTSVKGSPLARVLDRCLDESLDRRFPTIDDLRVALREVSGVKHALRHGTELDEWRALEEGIGHQVIRKRPTARDPVPSYDAFVESPRKPPPLRPPQPPPPKPPSPARDAFDRGKALFAAGRLDEARAQLERALALDPMLIEAMHLRREVDRLATRTRAEAGHAYPVNRDIDDALAKSARLEAALARLDADEPPSVPANDRGKMPSGT